MVFITNTITRITSLTNIKLQKQNRMKNKSYHTVGIFPKSNWKTIESGKMDTPKYMTAPYHVLVLVFKKWWEYRLVLWTSLLSIMINSEHLAVVQSCNENTTNISCHVEKIILHQQAIPQIF